MHVITMTVISFNCAYNYVQVYQAWISPLKMQLNRMEQDFKSFVIQHSVSLQPQSNLYATEIPQDVLDTRKSAQPKRSTEADNAVAKSDILDPPAAQKPMEDLPTAVTTDQGIILYLSTLNYNY